MVDVDILEVVPHHISLTGTKTRKFCVLALVIRVCLFVFLFKNVEITFRLYYIFNYYLMYLRIYSGFNVVK